MANPHRGEARFETDGRTYTLRFDINTICALEESLDLGITEIGRRLADPKAVRVGLLRAVLHAGLQRHHPEIEVTTAGDLMAEAGVEETMRAVQTAFERAFPPAEAGDARPPEETKATPPAHRPGQAGAGPSS